ncbi:MAG: 30S ribosomal protein S11 [bacterium]|nr:30S ribosomal protein S11 [bacterium]
MGKKKVTETTTKAEGAPEAAAATVTVKRSKRVEAGRVYVNASYNNTIVSVTDVQGNLLAWATAGSLGFSGPKKATPFAASKIVAVLAEKMKAVGMSEIDVIVKGIGGGRDSAVRSFVNQGFLVHSLKDVTPVPHNGARPKKTRRV